MQGNQKSGEAERQHEAEKQRTIKAEKQGKVEKQKAEKQRAGETEIQKLVERVVHQRRNDRGIRCDVSEVQVVLGRLGHDQQS